MYLTRSLFVCGFQHFRFGGACYFCLFWMLSLELFFFFFFSYEDYADKCQVGNGAIYSCIALILFYFVSTLLCCLPRPDNAVWQSRRQKQELLEVQQNGGVVTTTTSSRTSTTKTSNNTIGPTDERDTTSELFDDTNLSMEFKEHYRQLKKKYDEEGMETGAGTGFSRSPTGGPNKGKVIRKKSITTKTITSSPSGRKKL
jgi:hypothetical protein